MPKTPTREDDLAVLEMLHLRDHGGLSGSRIAAALGVPLGRVTGALHRVKKDDTATPDHARHLDGTMPPRWWAGS